MIELKFDKKDIAHVARHLATAPELGGKFNSKLDDAEKLLDVLVGYLKDKIDPENLVWYHNPTSGTDTVELSFTDNNKLKESLDILPEEPLGYHYIVEITEQLRPMVLKKPRGTRGDDKAEVNVIKGIKPQPTDELIIHLKKRPGQEGVFISTAYPGTRSPFLPNKEKQTKEEYENSLKYWNNHAFIE